MRRLRQSAHAKAHDVNQSAKAHDVVHTAKRPRAASRGSADCEICREPSDERVDATPCGHRFHASCLAAWLSEKAQRDVDDHEDCPMCQGWLRMNLM